MSIGSTDSMLQAIKDKMVTMTNAITKNLFIVFLLTQNIGNTHTRLTPIFSKNNKLAA